MRWSGIGHSMRWVVVMVVLVGCVVSCGWAADDCTTFCNPIFGPGMGVTCQAAVPDNGPCLERCFYANGWWLDAQTNQVIRAPHGGDGDQRPRLVDVPPYGYATAFGYQAQGWIECPGSYFGVLPVPPHVWEGCQAVARAEYHEGEGWCSQWVE